MADRAVDPDEMADDDWVGSVDARGRPHGRGTLRLGKRSRFEGRMHHGCRRGMGTLYVDEASDDETEGDGVMSRLRVPWLDDAPHGRGVFTEPDGAELHGTWADGALEGLVLELRPNHLPAHAMHLQRAYLPRMHRPCAIAILSSDRRASCTLAERCASWASTRAACATERV